LAPGTGGDGVRAGLVVVGTERQSCATRSCPWRGTRRTAAVRQPNQPVILAGGARH